MFNQFKKTNNLRLAISRNIEKNSELYGAQNNVVMETLLPETIQEEPEELDETTKITIPNKGKSSDKKNISSNKDTS
jgi:hypothetical protein